MSSHVKAELAAACSTLGRLHKGEYLIEPDCIESVKDLIRYLKRDNETHEIRRYLGASKVLQKDLVHILKSCPEENSSLFDVTLRLLINLTTPAILFFRDEIPADKIGRNIYLSLIGYGQDYKIAFCDVEFWSKVCGKLTNLFETDWTERSADDGIQIERLLLLLRNVLQIPIDEESEKRPENDLTIHDKVLWALRQSQILELLLLLSTNRNEEQYFLNLLEIFSLVLREQNAKVLSQCDIHTSGIEKTKDAEDLVKVREFEKLSRNKYLNVRNFSGTFVMKGVKSLSNNDVVCHKFLDKPNLLKSSCLKKKQVRVRKNRVPVESERPERRSTFSTRLFLKEFCVEFLTCSFNNLMNVVKHKLASGKSLCNDQSYYFWALKFFLDFAVASNSNVTLIQDLVSVETFHFIQMSMDDAFEHLVSDKKKTADWVKRIHLTLKAYRSLLETLLWMDCATNALARSISREIKSQIFFLAEYREMTLNILLRYDQTKFSMSYFRDLIETVHLFIKLLEEYARDTKLIVQKVVRKKSKFKKDEQVVGSLEEKWEEIKNDVYDILSCENQFPEIPPFDAALEIPIDDQKERTMRKIQKLLHLGKIKEGIGLLRSAREVWPENESFGSKEMSIEDEAMALQEICVTNLGEIVWGDDWPPSKKKYDHYEEKGKEKTEVSACRNYVVNKDFDVMDYKKRLVNKKVIEGCGTLLKNYQKNSNHTNHCIIKFLYRVGWECCMPAMLYQASLFWTLLKILQDKNQKYNEINTFTVNLLRRFRKHATKHPVVFLDFLFWKDYNVALEIQHGYEPYSDERKAAKHNKKDSSKTEIARSHDRKQQKLSNCENSVEQSKSTGKKKAEKQNICANISNSDEFHVVRVMEDENESLGLPKNGTSKILFKNNSNSDGSTAPSSKNLKPSFAFSGSTGDKDATIKDVLVSEKQNEGDEKQRFEVSRYKPVVNSDKNDIQSAESEEDGDSKKFIDIHLEVSPRRKSNSMFIDVNKETDATNGYFSKNPSPLVAERDTNKEPKSQSEDSNVGTDTDKNTIRQTSSAFSKKRVRKANDKRNSELVGEDLSESNHSKSKRVRYVTSDSDNYQSEDEELIPVRPRKWRKLALIDSGSDEEPIREDISNK